MWLTQCEAHLLGSKHRPHFVFSISTSLKICLEFPMDDDGWNRPLYVTWSMSMDRINLRNLGLQIAKNYHVQSNSHYTRPVQMSQSAELFLFPSFSGYDKLLRIRIDRVWCEMDCNFPTVAVRGISYLVQSTLVQTSQISHFNISCFLDTKNQFNFSVWMWQVLFGKLMNHFRRVNKCKWVIIRIDFMIN